MVAFEREPSPVSAAAPGADAIPFALRRRGGSPRQVFLLTLLGTIVLAVFASRDLVSWLDRMGGGPILEPLQHAAAGWDGAIEQLRLTRPHERLRATVRDLTEQQW